MIYIDDYNFNYTEDFFNPNEFRGLMELPPDLDAPFCNYCSYVPFCPFYAEELPQQPIFREYNPNKSYGPSYGPPGGPSYGPPSSGPQGGQSYGPPSGGPPGSMQESQSGAPSGPPPSATPSKNQAQVKSYTGVKAVEPGTLKPCRYTYVYIWPRRGSGFWAWLTYVGRRSASGYRWNGYRWYYFGIDLNNIDSFICY